MLRRLAFVLAAFLPLAVQTAYGQCILTCPANVTRSNNPGQCGAVVTYPAPTTSGTCGTVSASPASGSFFPKGTTTVTVSNTADANTCTFTVTVNDTQSPTLACPTNQATPATSAAGAVVNYPAPSSVSDNCPGVVAVCSPASGSFFPGGATTVNCTATDASSNTASCQFSVNVLDADLSISKSGPATFTSGFPVTFSLSVHNNGPSSASNIVVVDTLPAGLSMTSFTVPVTGNCTGTTVVTCSFPTLTMGNGATLPPITITANGNAAGGTVTNTATVSSDSPDFVPANNTSSFNLVSVVPALSTWALIVLALTVGVVALMRMRA